MGFGSVNQQVFTNACSVSRMLLTQQDNTGKGKNLEARRRKIQNNKN